MKNIILQKGDVIKVWRDIYWHFGIYVGNNKVIHFSGQKRDKLCAVVKKTSLSSFAKGAGVNIVEYDGSRSPNEVVRYAESQLGRGGYNLVFSNCEHFARECKTGEGRSEQVEGVVMVGGLATVVAIASRRPQIAVAIGVVFAATFLIAVLAEHRQQPVLA
ncbi:MAG: lecithin retinol acyltransferase family protein [Thermodesulfobacteriota bacterium]